MTLFDPSSQVLEAIEPVQAQSPSIERPIKVVRVAFGISYDGGSFHGFAPQPGLRTVAGEFCRVLGELVGKELTCVCAGRTDAGVHAIGQIVHVDIDPPVLAQRFGASVHLGEELSSLARASSSRLGPDMAIWRAAIVPDDFDARRSAISRRYRYRVDFDNRISPLARTQAWQLDEPLDIALLRIATDALFGEHDFAAFCRQPPDRAQGPLVRRVLDASWKLDEPGHYVFEIEANAFCHQMVRSIVGTLVAIGTGKIRPNEVVEALRRATRADMAAVAPAHGLCLVKVSYPQRFAPFWL